VTYRLLKTFEGLFAGEPYLHRRPHLGDLVAVQLFEDVYSLGRSSKFVSRVDRGLSVVNVQNQPRGMKRRRGDGSFGEIVPNVAPLTEAGCTVKRGPIATIEIGVEVKIVMKAMLKQIDRVITVLKGQAAHFRSYRGDPICVGVVGVNHATHCTTYEGNRAYPTDGKHFPHPISEAQETTRRLRELAAPDFDEFIILPFEATNEPPYPFTWISDDAVVLDYGAALARICQAYEARV